MPSSFSDTNYEHQITLRDGIIHFPIVLREIFTSYASVQKTFNWCCDLVGKVYGNPRDYDTSLLRECLDVLNPTLLQIGNILEIAISQNFTISDGMKYIRHYHPDIFREFNHKVGDVRSLIQLNQTYPKCIVSIKNTAMKTLHSLFPFDVTHLIGQYITDQITFMEFKTNAKKNLKQNKYKGRTHQQYKTAAAEKRKKRKQTTTETESRKKLKAEQEENNNNAIVAE